MVKPVILVLGASALPLARHLKEPLGAEIHTPRCVDGGDELGLPGLQHAQRDRGAQRHCRGADARRANVAGDTGRKGARN